MRVLVAPDKYAGTLSAAEAADAIARGWHEARPADALETVPLADGGPGFLDVLYGALGGQLLDTEVRGPYGVPVTAQVLLVDGTAYVESAQACGLALTGAREAARASTYGVGELLLAARAAGARRIVVGLGGSGSNDGGAGLLAALGAGADRPLERGGAALAGIGRLEVPSWELSLVAATDVSNPLVGPSGASRIFGPQKGLEARAIDELDRVLGQLAHAAGSHGRALAAADGAGAAGGLGWALLLLGASRESGFDVVARATGLLDRVRRADLILTGEGSYDDTGAAGKVPGAVAAFGAGAGTRTIVLAGRVQHPSPAAYSLVDLVGEEAALGRPADSLAALARYVASVTAEADQGGE